MLLAAAPQTSPDAPAIITRDPPSSGKTLILSFTPFSPYLALTIRLFVASTRFQYLSTRKRSNPR